MDDRHCCDCHLLLCRPDRSPLKTERDFELLLFDQKAEVRVLHPHIVLCAAAMRALNRAHLPAIVVRPQQHSQLLVFQPTVDIHFIVLESKGGGAQREVALQTVLHHGALPQPEAEMRVH